MQFQGNSYFFPVKNNLKVKYVNKKRLYKNVENIRNSDCINLKK